MRQPLVSVVIPLYEGAAHIAETLRSVAAQTYPHTEIIVVDDDSPDDGVALALASGVPLRLVRQQRSRVSAARNRGLAESRGELVCFLDQDDHWYENHLEGHVQSLQADPDAGVVFSPYQHWYPGPDGWKTPAEVLPARPSQELDPDYSGWIYHQFLLDCWALTSATTIRREVLQRHGGFEEQRLFSEDWELWLRLSRHTRFLKRSWPPVLYRQHPAQGSRIARPTDHRTELLLAHAAAHGLASRDGRAVPQAVFDDQIAHYEMEFGYLHLCSGDRGTGVRALLRAWRRRPLRWRYLALAAAATVGWQPRVDRASTQIQPP